jgi:UDP-N-acetyl-2-amino-2-deoxyglucuronate dehydrogenase
MKSLVTKPLRFGLAGTGGIAAVHATCLKQLAIEGVAELVAGADVDPAIAKSFSDKWGVPVLSTVEELVARPDIDAIAICTPSGLHCDHAVLAMDAGKHALVEKPTDVLVSKVEAAIAASKRNNVTMGCVFQQRFPAGPQKVKKAIEQGYFGEIIYAHCETPWYRGQEYYDSGAWRGTWALDCGVLSNQGPHMIDRLLWLVGDVKEVLSATCDAGSHRDIEAETNAAAIIRFENGALGTITGTTLARGSMPQRVLICGTEGSASFEINDITSFETTRPFEYDGEEPIAASKSDGNAASDPKNIADEFHKMNIKDFSLAVLEGRQPAVTAEDGLRLVKVLSGIYTKAAVGPYAK